MKTSSRAGWTGLIVAAAFVVAAQPAAAGKTPDFAVKAVTFLGDTPYHIVLDRTGGGLIVNVKVKNEGGSTAAGEGKLIFSGLGALQPTKFDFEIPKIKPGKSDTIQLSLEGADLDGITTYTTKGCAVAKNDANNRNGCRTGPGFAAIPRTWVGTTDAVWSDGLTTQSLVSNHATFTFDAERTATTGKFTYLPTGSLTATIIADEDDLCTLSGTGDTAVDPAHGSLVFEPDLLSYQGQGRQPPVPPTFTGHASCPNEDGTTHTGTFEQEFGVWLLTAIRSRDADDEVLTGTQTTSGPDRWTWNLRAE